MEQPSVLPREEDLNDSSTEGKRDGLKRIEKTGKGDWVTQGTGANGKESTEFGLRLGKKIIRSGLGLEYEGEKAEKKSTQGDF